MNVTKAKAFNEKMGKAKHFPRHLDMSKGGMIDKRKHFDDGGVATTVAPAIGGQGGNGNTTQGGLIGGITQQTGYQASLAPTTQLNYAPTVGAASTAALNPADVNAAIAAEQGLAGQYGNIAAGTGPNPALTALANQTGTNVANTAALQAGQRGSSGNVGLMAREIGQTGAATQQTAVGQAANTQANQSLNALSAEGALQGQIGSQALGEQGTAASVYGTAANANTGQNNTNVSNFAQAQGLNQATAAGNTSNAAATQGGLIGGIGTALTSIFDKGGEVKKMDAGGSLDVNTQLPGAPAQPVTPLTGPTLQMAPMPGAQIAAPATPNLGVNTSLPIPQDPTIGGQSVGSYIGKVLQGEGKGKDSDPTGFRSLGSGLGAAALALAKGGKVHPGPHKSHVANYLFADGGTVGGDKVPALVSAKEVYLNPHQVHEVVERGADPMKIGHHFPGTDKVKKNSQKNDVIPVTLEDGGVVLPISVTTHKDASEKGRKFVERAHAKRYLKKPKGI